MFGRIMNLQFVFDASCLLGWVSFVERGNLMGVEVIHDKDYFVRFRITVYQVFDFLSPVCCRAMLSNADMMPATKRLYKAEDATSAIALVL